MKALYSLNILIFACVFLTVAEPNSSDSKIMKRGSFTWESCANACVTETAIKCRFVNFNSITGKCILSASVGIPLSYLSRNSEGDMGNENIARKVANLENQLNEIKENVEEFDEISHQVGDVRVEAERASKSRSQISDEVQNSKMDQEMAVATLNWKVGSLAVGMQRTLSDTKAFKNLHDRFEKELAEIKHDMRSLAFQVRNILEKTSHLPSDISRLREKSATLTRDVNNIKDNDNSFMQDLAEIKDEMTSTYQSLKPQLKEIKMSQAKIIEDMSHLDIKEESHRNTLSLLESKLNHGEEDTKDVVTSVYQLFNETKMMKLTIKETQTDITKRHESFQNLQTSNANVQQQIELVRAKHGEEHARITNVLSMVEKTTSSMESISSSQKDFKTEMEEMTMKRNEVRSGFDTMKAAREHFPMVKDILRIQDTMKSKLNSVLEEQYKTRGRLSEIEPFDSNTDDVRPRELKQLSERLDDVESVVEKLKLSVHKLDGKISKRHCRLNKDEKGSSKKSKKDPRTRHRVCREEEEEEE